MAKEMTKQQRDYAIGRVKGLRDVALRRIKESHPAVPDAPDLENSDMVKLVRAGKVKMYPTTKDYSGYQLRLNQVFDFCPIKGAAKKAYEAEKAKILKTRNKETGPIYAESINIIDKIMLGDAAEALKLIEGFAKMCKK